MTTQFDDMIEHSLYFPNIETPLPRVLVVQESIWPWQLWCNMVGHDWAGKGWDNRLNNPLLERYGGVYHIQQCSRCGQRRKVYETESELKKRFAPHVD